MPGEFNEEIARSFFELQGYLVRMNVPYRPVGTCNDSSDIDIVAVHHISGPPARSRAAHRTAHDELLEGLAAAELHLRVRHRGGPAAHRRPALPPAV